MCIIIPHEAAGAHQRRTCRTGHSVNTGVAGVINEKSHSKLSYPIVHRLLLRELFRRCQLWFTPALQASAHPIVHDCSPELFNKADHLLRIFRLVKESCRLFLLQQGLRSLFDLLQRAEKKVSERQIGHDGAYRESSARLCSSSGSIPSATAARLSFSLFNHGMSCLAFSLTSLLS